jgi:hypothetical protein
MGSFAGNKPRVEQMNMSEIAQRDCTTACCTLYQADGEDVSLHLHNNLPAVLVPLHLLMRHADLRPREHLARTSSTLRAYGRL